MPTIQKPTRQVLVFLILVVFIISLISIAIYTVTAGNTIGTDILVFYLAGRSSFIDGQGPYVTENFIQSQMMVYGHPASVGEDPLIFGYPPYSLFPLLPLFFIPFQWTQAIWLAILLAAIILIPFLIFPNSPRWLPASLFLLFPFSFGLLMGNFAIPIGIIIMAVYGYLFHVEKAPPSIDFIAGAALAWSTAKPQFIWLFLVFYFIAALKLKRHWLIYGFITAIIIFLLFSFVVSPTWVSDWWLQVQNYKYSIPTNLHLTRMLSFIESIKIKALITSLFSIVLIVWMGRKFHEWFIGKIDPIIILCWIGFTTHLFYPGGVAYEQIVFMIPFILWITINGGKNRGLSLTLWALAISISWLEFVLNRLLPGISTNNELLFCYYVVWMIIIVEYGLKNLNVRFFKKNMGL
ncbi:MAG TPA: hypothetical protein VFC41_07110 [Anaerovoracaceae bacterium]|nr:hypothetical protein [Anaerovoracaceae bacterium]